MLQVTSQKQLAKIRRHAKKRGFRVVRDNCGNFSVIDTRIEPPRPLLGLDHAPLWAVEQAVLTPLPEPPPRRKPVARLTEPAPVVQTVAPAETGASAPAQAHHGFLALVEAMQTKGSAS